MSRREESNTPSTSVMKTIFRTPSADAISPAAVSAFTFNSVAPSAPMRTATGAMIGMNPAAVAAMIDSVFTRVILATYPNCGSRTSPCRMPPSTPDMPMALPPLNSTFETNCLFINPVRTATTMSRLDSSVNRRPLTNRVRTPCFSIQSVMTFPPP